MERTHTFNAAGLDLDGVAEIVARITGVKPTRISISMSVQRGEQIVEREELSLSKELKI